MEHQSLEEYADSLEAFVDELLTHVDVNQHDIFIQMLLARLDDKRATLYSCVDKIYEDAEYDT